MTKKELQNLLLERIEQNIIENLSDESATVQESLYKINDFHSFEYFRAVGQLDKLEEIYAKQFEEVLKMFFENSGSLFYRQIDLKAIENLFFWMNDFYKFIAETDNVKFLKSHFPVLRSMLNFFLHSTSSYVSVKNQAYLETRSKKEFPFMPENSLFVSSYINILWYNFLSIMNFFAMRLFNIRTSGLTEDLIQYIEKTFVSMFWDEEEKNLRFSASDSIPTFSSLSIWSMGLSYNNLLFKQKKKKLLNTLASQFYSDTGLLTDFRKRDKWPELLPVFWTAYLRFFRSNAESTETVKKWVQNHLQAVDFSEFHVHNKRYNQFFLEFLVHSRIDF